MSRNTKLVKFIYREQGNQIYKSKKFVDNFDLDLVHLHVNNFCNINDLSNPSVIELTFCDKRFSSTGATDKIKYPIENLDAPCNKNKQDKEVVFY